MATLYHKKGCNRWYARVKLWDSAKGAWLWKSHSTGTDNEEKALAIAEEFERTSTMAKNMDSDSIDVDQIRNIVEGIMKMAGVSIRGGNSWPKLRQFVIDYTKAQYPKITPSSAKTYKTMTNHFTSWLDTQGSGMTLDWFTPAMANQYYTYTLEGMAVKSANDRLKHVKRIFTHAIQIHGYPSNPCVQVRMTNQTKGEKLDRLPFSRREVDQILDYLSKGTKPKHIEWRRAVMLSFMSSCRLEDALTMHSDNLKYGVISYIAKKTKKQQVCPLVVPEWADELAACPGHFCPTLFKEFKASANANTSSEFTEIVSLAGVEQKHQVFSGSGRKVARKTFHSLRHALRTAIYQSGGTDTQADMILGHSAGQGRQYTHADERTMRETLERALRQA